MDRVHGVMMDGSMGWSMELELGILFSGVVPIYKKKY